MFARYIHGAVEFSNYISGRKACGRRAAAPRFLRWIRLRSPVPVTMNHLSIRIEFETSGGSMDPTMALLLDRVRECGSIRKAAASLGMGYRNAWGLIQGLQETFKAEIVTTETGGAGGGGSKLTSLGTELLASYRRIEAQAESAARADMNRLNGMIHGRQAAQIPAVKFPPGRGGGTGLARPPRPTLRTKSH
jgi:molybdate transport system regulatory protein